jgi:hypothetical protein
VREAVTRGPGLARNGHARSMRATTCWGLPARRRCSCRGCALAQAQTEGYQHRYFLRESESAVAKLVMQEPSTADSKIAAAYIPAGKEFLSTLAVDRRCIIATITPYSNQYDQGEGRGTRSRPQSCGAKARWSLDIRLLYPDPRNTDVSSIRVCTAWKLTWTPASAQRWSTPFCAAASPQIRKYLDAR